MELSFVNTHTHKPTIEKDRQDISMMRGVYNIAGAIPTEQYE